MFEKLTQYIIDSEPTVLNSATPDYEPHDYKLIVLEDVLTDEEIGYCKFAFNDPDININWGFEEKDMSLSSKDQNSVLLKDIESPFYFEG